MILHMRNIKLASFYAAMILIVLLSVELFCAAFLFFSHRQQIPAYANDGYRPAAVSAAQLLMVQLERVARRGPADTAPLEKLTYRPDPLFYPDPVHGYKAAPGEYVARYAKRTEHGLEHLNTKITINPDGSRFTGSAPEHPASRVYVFGDSFVFGEGVSDEQTFTYLLQSSLRETAFHLRAMSGYSLTNAYVNFLRIKSDLTQQDTLVLGYADYYKDRHVASPSRMKAIQSWIEDKYPNRPLNPQMRHLRARLDGEKSLVLDTVHFYCRFDTGYCDQPDPSVQEADAVTLELIKAIARQSKARVLLLHFKGEKSDPVLAGLPPNVQVVSALPQDFDFRIDDDILGFDNHPGPYWHYAMFTKLRAALQQ
jgi:hypothetical protein